MGIRNHVIRHRDSVVMGHRQLYLVWVCRRNDRYVTHDPEVKFYLTEFLRFLKRATTTVIAMAEIGTASQKAPASN